jgi:hypothetical protein
MNLNLDQSVTLFPLPKTPRTLVVSLWQEGIMGKAGKSKGKKNRRQKHAEAELDTSIPRSFVIGKDVPPSVQQLVRVFPPRQLDWLSLLLSLSSLSRSPLSQPPAELYGPPRHGVASSLHTSACSLGHPSLTRVLYQACGGVDTQCTHHAVAIEQLFVFALPCVGVGISLASSATSTPPTTSQHVWTISRVILSAARYIRASPN